MTTVYAHTALDLSTLDLRTLATGSVSLLDNVDFTSALGRVYQDALRITVDGSPALRTWFLGTGITGSVAAGITGGTIQAVQQDRWNGSAWTTAWGMEGFSYSAQALYQAVQTPGVDDDLAFLTTALAGNDTFTLSPQGDDVRGFAGNDRLDGRGGNDTLDGGIGQDTLLGGDGDDDLFGDDGNDSIAGGAGNDWIHGGAGANTLVGGAGNDTFFVGSGDLVLEDASAAGGIDMVRSGDDWTLGAGIEYLVLDGVAVRGTGNALDNQLLGNGAANVLNGLLGNDALRGSLGDDTLYGGGGNDTLLGGAGSDRMAGGTGNDRYEVESAGDRVVETSVLAGEIDVVESTISYVLPDNVEQLVLLGSGKLAGTGNALANTLAGNAGPNRLDGAAGADTMAGGGGDDNYVVDQSGDSVIEAADAGADLVLSSVGYTLSANVEALTLTGSAAIDGRGNALANTLTGNTAANRLDGAAGADTLAGGGGDDTYVVDQAGDTVVEAASAGTDTVLAAVSWVLPANVERLTLTGSAAIDGSGNTLANRLIGNAAANHLSGGAGSDLLDGGGGADTLAGGSGSDRYIVDNAGDRVVEAASAGNDVVVSGIGYALGANVEVLTLTGSAAIDGRGNTLANTITGNASANRLDGGAGADTLAGGAGDDVYVVDDPGDVLVEAPGGGTDTVRASLGWTLGADFERLVLTGNGVGTVGVGNDTANLLIGSAATNQLQGRGGDDTLRGGLGNDALIGGSGHDAFRFDTAPDSSANVDALYDFSPVDDRIELSAAVYSALGPAGPLAAGAFRVGSAAVDADDRILFDDSTGRLLYDADGSGAIEAVAFAAVSGALVTSTADDFWIV